MTAIASPPETPFKFRVVQRGPGEECQNCKEFWEHRGQKPKLLHPLPPGDYGTPMAACPWCDGPVVEMQRNR